MEEKKISVLNHSLIWFGAGVSIAEIMTGVYFAPLGLKKGIAAILLGHVIGCTLLFFAGYIGALSKRSAMETVKMSFGTIGSRFFAVLNILQLVGWTSIMIYDGAEAAEKAFHAGTWFWALIIGALIIVWILIGITNLGKINKTAMTALFVLTLVLSKVIFFGKAVQGFGRELNENFVLSFGAAVELAAAMPLSWLPLISDYTKAVNKPFKATIAGTVSYGIVSCWMYIIGMGAALFTGETSISVIMVKSGLGLAALIIVILSTVTTTFMDVFSAGISAETVSKELNGKTVAACVTIIGVMSTIFFPPEEITGFLYLIGSVFAPMIAIQLADFFVLKSDSSEKRIDAVKMIIWLSGFVLYGLLIYADTALGSTLPDIAATFILCILAGKVLKKRKRVN